MARLEIGKSVGRYIVESKAGSGGMAEVFCARHDALGTMHALKVLSVTSEKVRERLLQEGRIQARMRHPNIVAVTDVLDVDSSPVLVMEYVDGPSLSEVLEGDLLSLEQVDHLVWGITAGVMRAHRHGLVHRDLKPANILLSHDDDKVTPKITDFGIAKLVGSGFGDATVTRTGQVMGSPAYMAPEQMSDSKSVDERADVFSLGVLFYEMVCGVCPFQGKNLLEIFEQIRGEQYQVPTQYRPDLPPRMSLAIARALRAQPQERTATAEQLGNDWFDGMAPPGRETRVWAQQLRLDWNRRPVSPMEPPAVSTTMTFDYTSHSTGEPDETDGVDSARTEPRRRLLPVEPSTLFVGRANCSQRIADAFDKGASLVSVVGPAGSGKSRLALRYAVSSVSITRVCFCDLDGARTFGEMFRRLAALIEVVPDPRATERQLVDQLGHALAELGSDLVVLDNVDQVLDQVVSAVSRWLEIWRGIRCLITSRERMGSHFGQMVELEPLSQEEATKLFIERAAAAKGGKTINEEHIDAVKAIVDKLDCMPLAIELAAARAHVLAPPKLLQRLSKPFQLLRARTRDADSRHSSIQHAIELSWELLDPHEQDVLAQCGVFRGGFDLDAAEAVISLEHQLDAPEVLDVLESLRDKSLLRTYPDPRVPDEVRFGSYESVRAFANENRGEVISEERHAVYFDKWAVDLCPQLHTERVAATLSALSMEADNLETALRYSADLDADRTGRLALALERLLAQHGPACQLLDLLDLAVTRASGAGTVLEAELLKARADLNARGGNYEQARTELEKALRLSLRLDAPALESSVRRSLGHIGRTEGGDSSSLSMYQAALACAQRAGDGHREALAHKSLAILHYELGDYTNSRKAAELAVQIPAGSRDPRLQIEVSGLLGILERTRGRFDLADEHYKSALSVAKSMKHKAVVATLLGNYGSLYLELAQHEKAEDCLARAASIQREMGNKQRFGALLGTLGTLELDRGSYPAAERYFEEAVRVHQAVGNLRGEGLVLANWGIAAHLATDLDRALKLYERANDVLNRAGSRSGIAYLACFMVVAHAESGNLDEATRLRKLAAEALADLEDAIGQRLVELVSGSIEVYCGEYEVAQIRLGAAGAVVGEREARQQSLDIRVAETLLRRQLSVSFIKAEL